MASPKKKDNNYAKGAKDDGKEYSKDKDYESKDYGSSSYGSEKQKEAYTDEASVKNKNNQKSVETKKSQKVAPVDNKGDKNKAKLVPSAINRIVCDPNVPYASKCKRGMDRYVNYEPGLKGKIKHFLNLRSRKQWIQLLLFYMTFYFLLGGYNVFTLNYLYLNAIEDKPVRNLNNSQNILYSPGMEFIPKLTDHERMKSLNLQVNFSYSVSKPKSFTLFVNQIRKYVKKYKVLSGERKNCATGGRMNCKTGLGTWGDCCPHSHNNSLGWKEGKPCIMLKLNKIYGWQPKEQEIQVKCSKRLKLTKKKYGESEPLEDIFPSSFSSTCFPFCGDRFSSKMRPIVFVKLNSIERDKWTEVYCEAIDGNIDIHKNDRQGSIRFEILINN